MSITKSTMMIAIFGLFLCLTSTVAAADLYNPGKPLNCTTWADNCKALTLATYGNGKNETYTGPSSQCNVTNLSGAQPLCGENVICLATFLIKAGTVTTTTTTAATPAPTGTNSTSGGNTTVTTPGPSSMYTVGSVDMTSQLLSMYDTLKCSAAFVQAATSVTALLIVASIVSLMSNML
ncbi:hypothetical protein BC939DRAFT_446568 [Gamsiella multidivaricata]|uniref:uncharacterized protein n=1 Tax=Gamsiella multidivaricata TaxID=101098 RepID=UPI0022200039|nr:uncharacterized protein BC939DRAFT_446568 [Gamsiella multidivaricata]KAG0365407.1 hypothetical protein BGZ54_006552 [Gamsiella multidivaricata]KAI7826503.1 hypothetical protein BC939DRAFT_446568 [Gamsiella multidivaricata]